MLVLVVLLGFDRRGARRSARGVGAVRWIRVVILGVPKLASTDGLLGRGMRRRRARCMGSQRSQHEEQVRWQASGIACERVNGCAA